jgi:hypothetical protein
MIKLIKSYLEFCILPLYFGGGGSSSSTSANTNTTNNDNRMVVSDSGVGLSNVSNSNVTMTTTDHGAINGAFTTMQLANDASAKNYGTLLNTSAGALDGIMKFANNAVTKSFDSAAQASQNSIKMMDVGQSKGTLDNKTIVMLGGGALLVVAMFVFRK